MKTTNLLPLIFAACFACTSNTKTETPPATDPITEGGQSTVQDDESQKNIVQVAIASPDHKTLVTALKAAEYVDVLANAGPFTVFAPTDAAFAKLPAGTVEDLLKPENKEKLRDILEYHVYVGVIRENIIQDGMDLNQVNGSNVKLGKVSDKLTVNGANIAGAVPTSNGLIYVIDEVLLPPDK
ncbi:MAG TPA: fasciclin domain-containing protein [Cyclobacteriaceae bacterium]|nr:fasciclin domain-containing protein [Cyclobacteriaceae bacterium]